MIDYDVKIEEIRRNYGKKLFILGHHYQRSIILKHADALGDSLELSKKAASNRDAEKIVFCGVKFMAESADVLTSDQQVVYMPDTAAGCPMSDMANDSQMMTAWESLNRHVPNGFIPVVYVNSSAAVKACCGRLGGSTCTSSNAGRIVKWALDQDKKVLFMPDEHLGRNTAYDLGIPDEEVSVYDPAQPDGGLTASAVRKSKVIVWKGFCIVHVSFTAEQVKKVREAMPYAKIIVHPEAPKEVVRLCDAHGSTAQIIEYAEKALAGSTIVIGTELNLVQRLAEQHRGRLTIKTLNPSVCSNMAKTTVKNLLSVLEEWPKSNEVHVPPEIAKDARKALEKMISI